jgi:ankyrin repeat protein
MKKILLLFVLFFMPCFAAVTPGDFQKFLQDYSSSAERAYWSETVYAIEKNYSDEMVVFCLKKIGVDDPVYTSKLINTSPRDGEETEYKNILITCIRKNKPEILDQILSLKPYWKVNVSEHFKHYYSNYGLQKIKERKILNVAIEDSENSVEFLKILFKYGVDVNNSENYITHPYYYNYQKGEDHIRSPLISAVIKGKLEDVKLLLTMGAYSNISVPQRDSPLYLAISNDHLDIAETLLENNAHTFDGSLHYAVTFGKKDAVILLLNYGADPLLRYQNKTAIEIATQFNNLEIIDILMAVIFNKN